MTCPYCTAIIADGSRLCQSCGRLLAPSAPPPTQPQPQAPWQPPQSPSAPQAPSPSQAPWTAPPQGAPGPFGPNPAYTPRPFGYVTDPYAPQFDVRQLPPDVADTYRQHQFRATFSVLVTILVHFLTSGTASPFMVARKHSLLPRIKADDFTMARGAGFLFIPFYNFYWCFVLFHRTVDRLTLQTKLWETGGAPSRGLGTALGIFSVITAIPYLGLLLLVVPYCFLWPFYLGQMQATCNRLALAAAPAAVHSAMLQLERWMRLRWLGWMLLGPSFMVVTSAMGHVLSTSGSSRTESIIGMILFALVGAGGAVMLYFGSCNTRDMCHALSSGTPLIVAAYLRIDRIASWVVFWSVGIFGLFSLLVGVIGVVAGTPRTAEADPLSSLGQAAGLLLLAGYAVYKALQLKGQIDWLESAAAAPAASSGDNWGYPR